MNNNPDSKPAVAKKAPAPPPAKWWSPSMSLWFVLGFAVLAGLPYVLSAGKLVAQGQELSADALKKEMKAREGEKKKQEMSKEDPEKLREIKALAASLDGVLYGGGKAGLFQLEAAEWVAVPGFGGHDIKAMAVAADGALFVVHHDGVSARSVAGEWSEVEVMGEAHTVVAAADGAVYLGMKKPGGLLKLQADASWARVNDGLPMVAGAGSHGKEKMEKKDKKETED
jgi:ligand-binding sensor domain-containing protein